MGIGKSSDLTVSIEVSSNMNSDGVRHRAMPEQENKGRVRSTVLLHPGREGKEGRGRLRRGGSCLWLRPSKESAEYRECGRRIPLASPCYTLWSLVWIVSRLTHAHMRCV